MKLMNNKTIIIICYWLMTAIVCFINDLMESKGWCNAMNNEYTSAGKSK